MTAQGEVMTVVQAEAEEAAQRARAMAPGVIRAAAYLHAHMVHLPYHTGYFLAQEAEEWRTGHGVGGGDGSVVRLLVAWGCDAGQAMDVLDILRLPLRPKPVGELFPQWAALSMADRAAAWRDWKTDPESPRWVA